MNPEICPGAGHASQFAYNWHGSCTLMALAGAVTIAKRLPNDVASMQALMNEIGHHMDSQKWTDAPYPNGASTLNGICYEADYRGLKRLETRFYDANNPVTYDEWHNALLAHAGKHPFAMQVANGKAGKDVETGSADEATLNRHAILIVGKQLNGYIVADSDNPQVNSRFQIYNLATLVQMQPYSYVVFDVPVPAPVTPPPAPAPQPTPKPQPPKGTPQGWDYDTRNSGVLIAPNGIEVPHDMTTWVLLNPFWSGNVPLEKARIIGTDRYEQWFTQYKLVWTKADGVFMGTAGSEYMVLAKQLADTQGQVATLTTQLGDATTAAGQSKTALDALKAQAPKVEDYQAAIDVFANLMLKVKAFIPGDGGTVDVTAGH